MMSLSKMTLFLAASFATMQMSVAIVKPESFIHASAQVVNLNNNETFMVSSSPTVVNCVENKLEPVVVPPSSSRIVDVIPSIVSFEEVEVIKIAVSVATESNLFGQATHELIFFDKALFAFGPVRIAVLLCMVVMTILSFKWIFQKDRAMVDPCNGNKIHRTLALPMSETYLQLVPRAPRTLAVHNDCRDIVATSSTALVVYVPRTLATYNDCRDMVVVNTALVPYAPRTLATVASRAIVATSNCVALAVRAPRCMTIFNDCRDIVIYQDSPQDVTAPTAAAAETKTDCNFVRQWFHALCAVFRKLGDFFVRAWRRLCDLLFPMQSEVDYEYEVTNVMVDFDPTSMDLLYRVNEGINLDAPMAIDAAFIGPAFAEMRHPPTDFDQDELSVASFVHDVDIVMEDALPLATIYVDHHDYDNDESSIGFGDDAIYHEIFPEPAAMVPTVVLNSIYEMLDQEEPEPIKMFRDPQDDFDDEEDDQSTVDPTDDFDSQMEDLLFSFSKLSFKDSTVKTVSESEMDELADAFAKL